MSRFEPIANVSATIADIVRFVPFRRCKQRGELVLPRIPLSKVAFGALFVAIGVWGFVQGGFVAVWAPGIQPAGLRPVMAILCALVSVLAGAGLLWRRSAPVAARALLAFLVLWLAWCKGVALVHAPAEPASWESLGETAALLAAAWALASGLQGPRIVYGLSLIAFGAGHFGYPTMTASLVPAWLPWHLAWVYLTGAAYVAAGVALIIDRLALPAGALSALQMALFGILVWLAKIAAGAHDPDTLNETAISFALAVSGWVVASTLPHHRSNES